MTVETKPGAQVTTESAAAPSGQPPPTGQPPAAAGAQPPAQPAGAAAVKPEAQGAQAAEPGTKAEPAPPGSKVPEKYVLRVPEADRVYLEEGDLAHVQTVARQAGWSNDEAQAAVDEHIAMLRTQSDRWLTETQADPEYGGDKLAEMQRLGRAVIDRIRPVGHPRREGFLRLLNRGDGNQLHVVSFLADLGRLMAEDRPAAGRSSSGAKPADPVAKLYDHTPATS